MNLIEAVKKNNLELISKCIEDGQDINQTDKNTPLHIACDKNPNPQVIELLISSGAKVDSVNRNYPLHFLARNDSVECLKILLQKEVDANCKNKWTPLHFACYHNSPNVVRELIKFGVDLNSLANVNQKLILIIFYILIILFIQDNNSPINLAARYNQNYEIIKELIFAGCNVNLLNRENPIHRLFLEKKVDQRSLNLLLSSKCSLDEKNNETPLDLVQDGESKNLLDHYLSIIPDLRDLLERKEKCDLNIQCSDGEIFCHQMIFRARFLEKFNLEKIQTVLSKYKTNQVNEYLEFIYLGEIDYPKSFKLITEISEKFEIKNIENKIGILSLISDLTELSKDQKSKDFTILVSKKKICIHSTILLARSELYRGMFVSVDDKSNQVSDYSKLSFETLSILFNFFYTDSLPQKMKKKYKKELEVAIDYFQLNSNTNLKKLLQI
ncbi:ankyrin repeat ph and sec7 domain containing protein secg-related [Anaeramoeba ignava]|uniref:Ankyrin repeat ph and sec7 domain containing protein secg-related n=1 Tax=Anaeramoeba ignava TaxID=1746090 RepID=A0A9Q0RDJ2_ANAIG|nr:ankyrin repeat ph and sec7 domain containing protein secg-related [Anaeramoeba ignava]